MKTVSVFLLQPRLFSLVRMTICRSINPNLLYGIAFPYCKVFCTLSGQNTGCCQNRRTSRRAECIGFGSPKRISNATLNRKSWTRAHCCMGKHRISPFLHFFTRKASIFIQEQNNFSLMFPNSSFLKLTPYLAQEFPYVLV